MSDRPVYPDDASSSETWERQALRSQDWAHEARQAGLRRNRRQLVLGIVMLGIAVLAILAAVAMIVIAATRAV